MNEPINISFWGSPPYSAALLERLAQDGRFHIVFAVTQPDKPRHRQKGEAEPTAVKKQALSNGIPVFTPFSLKKESPELNDLRQTMKKNLPLFHVVFAYGKIIPEPLFAAPRMGGVNFHASLLPQLRGASPVESALLHGLTQTGWTLQKIDSRMDTGDILKTSVLEIPSQSLASDLLASLIERLMDFGPEALAEYAAGKLEPKPQQEKDATYCEKINTQMGEINWNLSAITLRNRARAFQERPGVYTFFRGKKLKLWIDPAVVSGSGGQIQEKSAANGLPAKPGHIAAIEPNIIHVACAGGTLPVCLLQPEGKKRMSAAEFVNGYRITTNDSFLV